MNITFPQPSVLTSLTGISYGWNFTRSEHTPVVYSNGVALTPQSSNQDPTTHRMDPYLSRRRGAYHSIDNFGRVTALILYAIDYTTAPVPMAILPDAPRVLCDSDGHKN